MTDEGKKALRAVASAVRARTAPSGEIMLHARGIKTIGDLASELAGPEAAPGLVVFRDGDTKLKLRRRSRNAEIVVEWVRAIGAIELTGSRLEEKPSQVRYVFDEALGHWRPMTGAGELWADLAAALVMYLFPEASA
jgi:hypothetical protein